MTSAASVRIQPPVHKSDLTHYGSAKPFSIFRPHTNNPYSSFQDWIESR